MNISFVDIQNFRKLKQCRIDFSSETTLFVGANNSGKTSAMDALGKFLWNRHFVYNDITLSNRMLISEIGIEWEKPACIVPEDIEQWDQILPSLDLWLNVENNELHYVAHIIPTLKWRTGILGVRLLYQPKDIENLFLEYRKEYNAARSTESAGEKPKKTLWPKDLNEFLEKRLNQHFVLQAYILDPEMSKNETPQKTEFAMECLSPDPLKGLIKIDMISAQRGFSDPEDVNNAEEKLGGNLSSQLRSYYDKHLDPEKLPTAEDLKTLLAMENATNVFNDNLRSKFNSAIKELESLGYPGINDPKITITTKVSPTEALRHDSAVQYSVSKTETEKMKLPEKYNGLGYQNLISIVFQLIRFRDDWIQEGKARRETEIDGQRIAPLHLVLLEEPEAHLHVQVQQVFIKKAYNVLTNHKFFETHGNFATQLVVSTHSTHITREVKFSNLRYFKRLSEDSVCCVATAKVVNLSEVFGKDDDTNRFVTRYLQTTHCDLFFADAAILVEGSAESMLVPHFINNKFSTLSERYITVLSINGKHSHRLKPLIEKLCLTTLVIADLDSAESTGYHCAARPVRGHNLISGNYAITDWFMKEKNFDKLVDIEYSNKELKQETPYEYSMRIAYQTPIQLDYKEEKEIEALTRTFEDCLIITNIDLFQVESGDGIINVVHKIINDSKTFDELHLNIYDALRNSQADKKAEFALDLIYSIEPDKLLIPKYIEEGLNWLQEQLNEDEQ